MLTRRLSHILFIPYHIITHLTCLQVPHTIVMIHHPSLERYYMQKEIYIASFIATHADTTQIHVI